MNDLFFLVAINMIYSAVNAVKFVNQTGFGAEVFCQHNGVMKWDHSIGLEHFLRCYFSHGPNTSTQEDEGNQNWVFKKDVYVQLHKQEGSGQENDCQCAFQEFSSTCSELSFLLYVGSIQQ